MTTSIHTRVAAAFALGTVAMFVACSGIDDPIDDPKGPELPDGASYGLVVSEPLSVQSSAAARAGSNAAATGIQQEVAFVSLPPGSFPEGEKATINNLMSGGSHTEPLMNGGLDPVPIPAAVGDTLETAILAEGGTVIFRMVSEVSARVPPVIVRTDPEKGKVDVLLNVAPIVVFSEPMDGQSLTPETIQLLLDGQPVDGTVILSPDGLRAGFTPAAALAPQTTYTLIIAAGIQDLSGDSLEEQVVVSFTTGGVAGRFTQVSAGWEHTCGITTDGEAYCWGWGMLGIGPSFFGVWYRPAPVQGGLRFTTVSAGGNYTCGVTTSGDPYCWGTNTLGQLGDGDQLGRRKYVPVPVSLEVQLQGLSAGMFHTCGVATRGRAYCWGYDNVGQLGNGASRYGGHGSVLVSGDLTFAYVSAGYQHTCGITTDGEAYCWGLGSSGELGTEATNEMCESGGLGRLYPCATTPVPVSGGLTFASVSAGFQHTCGITTDGEAYCWGNNGFGRLGNGSTDVMTAPSLVAGGLTFASVTAGRVHTCGVTTDGEAYCWGNNEFGQLGNGSTDVMTAPSLVAGGLTFASVTAGAGGGHTCGVTEDGIAYCWGANDDGQLGNGSFIGSSVPVRVADQR